MKPVIALVGRPNVGKSTLFNNLTRSRDALVADFPGLTRDRKYGTGRLGERPFLVIDTGGLSGEKEGIDTHMEQQARLAVEECDAVLFLVDAREGLNAADEVIAGYLRQSGKQVTLVVNKIDGLDADVASSDFHALGFGRPQPIAAAHGRGVRGLIDRVLAEFPEAQESEEEKAEAAGIKVAVIGRPNVGKSTLVNRVLGEERVVVFDMPGTTRDSIYVPFVKDGERYTFIDTAGVRRRGRVKDTVEKFSVVKTLQAVSEANVVVMVLDAREGIAEQDAHLLGFVVESGRALVIAINKWDGLSADQRNEVRRNIDLRLPFVDFARVHFISALHGSGVGDLFRSIKRAYISATRKLSTPELTGILESAVAAHQPPLVKGRRVKLRYAHQGGRNPPIIVIHGNQTEAVPNSYQRYLQNTFRDLLRLEGTPIRIEFKSGVNPYAGKKNTLSPRQIARRQRLVKFTQQREKQKRSR